MPRTVVEAKPKTMTLEEWADLDEDVAGELVDGVLEEEEMPSFLHEIIVTWLIAALHGWAERKGGQVAGSEAKIAVAPRRGRKPDVSVYLHEQPAAEDTLIRVTPHLVVEVASPRPRDARRDRVEKLRDYARAGIRFYWVVDPRLRSLEVFELAANGRYSLALSAGDGRARIPGCAGLVIDLDRLWKKVDTASTTSRQ
jgi:Uma2 family endonuclease